MAVNIQIFTQMIISSSVNYNYHHGRIFFIKAVEFSSTQYQF